MCGIFGFVSLNSKPAKTILNGLKKLEYRGYDSWGIVVKQNNKLTRERHVGKIGQAKTKLPKSIIGLGHTRWATHGGVTIGNAHPHFDCTQKLSLVHNGIIENFKSLKQSLIKSHQFKSETDTEVLLHLIEEELKTKTILKAIQSSFNSLAGMNAFIVFDSQNNQLIAVKKGSPLIVGLGQSENYISSDVWALLNYTKEVVFLEDDQMVKLTKNKATFYNANSGKKITPKITKLNWKSKQGKLGKFHHYMEKEIFDQPKIIKNLSKLDHKTLTPITNLIKQSDRTYFIGCGTAAYAGLFAEYLFDMSGFDVDSVVGSEFSKNKQLLNEKKSFIILSQSGETIDVIDAVNLARKKGLKIAGITNALGSTLYRMSNHKLLLNAGQEVAVASTKAFTAKLAIILQLNYLLSNQLKKGQKLLKMASESILKVSNGGYRNKIKKVAQKIKDQSTIFVIGRLQSYPIALEAALKIKEVSYIHAEGYAGGELKHGPIALIDQGTPCIVFAPNDQSYNDQISAANEMKARGGLIIGISPKNNDAFDIHFKVKDLKEATAITSTAITQLLAYDLAVARGLNPDKPRNLAKSVTVK